MTLEGKTILITCSTDGVGRRVALHLAGAGAEVLVHGRDRARGDGLVVEMRAGGNEKGRFYPADLSSLAEVRLLAKAVLHLHPRLHLLINNAGSGGGPARQRRDTSR